MTDPRSKPVPHLWQQPIEQWTRWLTAANRSRETIRTRTDHLRRLARALDGSPWHVTDDDLTTWAAAQTWGSETRRSVYNSVRQFFGWALEAGHIAKSPAERLPRVKAAPPAPRPCPQPILDAAEEDATPRVRLMLRLGAELGLRRAEIARVHADDLAPDLLGWTLRVHGKGGKVRVLPLSDGLASELHRACGEGRGYAFPGGVDGHLAPGTVGKMVSKAMKAGWATHSLRHRFATVAHHRSGDLLAVQQLLGHASPATTQRYVALGSGRLREVAAAAASHLVNAA